MEKNKPSSIEQYISTFQPEIQVLLEQMRTAIKLAAPNAEEAISYAMPTYRLKGNLVHFAAYANHIGFYPAPSGIESFKKELSVYKSSKGAVQFPINKPLPLELIAKIVKFRVVENLEKAELKRNKRI